nr:hypothetical protein BaRGS_024180 [Batillaria attramentaria]
MGAGVAGVLFLVAGVNILGITAGLALTAGARLSGDQKFFGLVAFIGAIAAGLLVLLPIVVYSSEVGSVEYGYSFVLMVMAFILCVAAAVLLFIGRILAVD